MLKTLTTCSSILQIIKKIQKYHSAAKKNDKARWLSLLSSNIEPKQLRDWGFNFSKYQLKKSRRIDFNSESLVGRQRISEIVKTQILQFIKSKTNPAAKRVVTLKINSEKVIKPVRYVSCCIKCLYLFL